MKISERLAGSRQGVAQGRLRSRAPRRPQNLVLALARRSPAVRSGQRLRAVHGRVLDTGRRPTENEPRTIIFEVVPRALGFTLECGEGSPLGDFAFAWQHGAEKKNPKRSSRSRSYLGINLECGEGSPRFGILLSRGITVRKEKPKAAIPRRTPLSNPKAKQSSPTMPQ